MDKSFDRTLLLVSVAAFLVILLILYKLFSWYNSNAESNADGAYEEIITDDMLSDADAKSKDVYDIDDSEAVDDVSSTDPEDEIDYTAKDKATTAKAAPVKKSASSSKTAASSAGEFMVIAGSFKQQDNANQRKDQLIKLGFPAEIVQFNNSSLYSVCAQRQKDMQSAQNTVLKLKNDHGINCYVQKKRQ